MIGARAFIAMSCTLMIFCAWVSDKRAAEHGEILGEHEHGAAVDRAPAGDHAVAGDFGLLHAEVARAVLDEHVELLERALVEQELDPLARGELAALVLRLDARLAAAGAGLGAALFQLVEDVLHGGSPFKHGSRQKPYHGGGGMPATAHLLDRSSPAPDLRDAGQATGSQL